MCVCVCVLPTCFLESPGCRQDGVPAHRHQHRSSSLGQEDPEPPAIKEEAEEPWCRPDGEQTTVKRESSSVMVTPAVDSSPDEKPEVNRLAEGLQTPQ